MVIIKIKNKIFWGKIIEHFYGRWSLKSEKVEGREVLAVKNTILESFHSVL